jgi:hypothetical protein
VERPWLEDGAEGTCLCGLINAPPECEKIEVQFLEGERLTLSAAAAGGVSARLASSHSEMKQLGEGSAHLCKGSA